MLTVLENPSDYNFSKSPVICEIETDNMYTSPVSGVKAKGMYTFSVGVPIGAFIEIITPTTTLHLDFISYTNPPTVGKLRTKNPADTFTDYWDKIESDMLLNAYISTNYTITQDGLGAFTLDAINTGAQYSLHNCVFNGTGINYFNYFNGTDDVPAQIKPNYEIRVELFVQTEKNSIIYESAILVKKQPYSTQKVKFDLSKFIDACLDYYFPIPGLSSIILCKQNAKDFYIQIKEFFGTPAVEQTVTINPSLIMEADGFTTKKGYILKAGLSPKWNRLLPNNQLNNYIWSYPLLLTSRPFKKTIKRYQPEYLYFCLPNHVVDEDLQIKVIRKYNDGSSDIIQYGPTSGPPPCTKGSVFCFPINYSTGIIDMIFSLNNPSIYKVIVSIVSQTDQSVNISPETEFLLDYNPIGEDRIFLFTNSMSGVDTLRTTGNYENSPEFEKDTATRIYNLSDSAHLGSNSENTIYKKETFTVFTGWLSKDDLEWIEEFFLSKYKVEVIDVNTYAPITITSSKFRKHLTNQNLYGIDIEYFYQLKSPVTDRLAAAI